MRGECCPTWAALRNEAVQWEHDHALAVVLIIVVLLALIVVSAVRDR